ncbi:hypothetical protein CRUP_002486 [Coryphaenoides rupestris]|nr:hypothetical protein CRUP_002486 [Coryphaenoides rupestris]
MAAAGPMTSQPPGESGVVAVPVVGALWLGSWGHRVTGSGTKKTWPKRGGRTGVSLQAGPPPLLHPVGEGW